MTEGTDRTVDIVVVGFGGAGLAAAITAHRAGAEVLVLEKQPEDRHTPSTRMSGGLIMSVDDAGSGTDYLDACAGGMIPRDVSAAWAERAIGVIDWLNGVAPGLDLTRVGGAEHPELPGADSIGVWQPGGAASRLDLRGKAGDFLFRQLAGAVRAAGVEVMFDQPVARLLTGGSGTGDGGTGDGVTGVETASGLRVHARRGVILCSGGYLHDAELKRNFLKAWPIYFYGNPGNTGDGVRMAQRVGADLWHMNQMIGRAIGNFELEDGTPVPMMLFLNPPGYVITDGDGRRFADESSQANLLHGFYYHLLSFDPDRGRYPRIPSYWFFDETRRRAGMLTLPSVGAHAVGLYRWSEDNSAEIERGWIATGATVEAAAAAAGHEAPAVAAAAVAEYNRLCHAGAPDPFGRPAETMVPLEQGPFYCVRLWPGGSNTTGGPRRDRGARVLDTAFAPIPGLYAAGELGQATGLMYPADGSNLSEAFCMGRIAAESALADNRGAGGAGG